MSAWYCQASLSIKLSEVAVCINVMQWLLRVCTKEEHKRVQCMYCALISQSHTILKDKS